MQTFTPRTAVILQLPLQPWIFTSFAAAEGNRKKGKERIETKESKIYSLSFFLSGGWT